MPQTAYASKNVSRRPLRLHTAVVASPIQVDHLLKKSGSKLVGLVVELFLALTDEAVLHPTVADSH